MSLLHTRGSVPVQHLLLSRPPVRRYGNTALHYSCEEERTEVAKLLISHGASRDLTNREEKTALEMAGPAFARTLKN